jgi:hypothetical protein
VDGIRYQEGVAVSDLKILLILWTVIAVGGYVGTKWRKP